MSTRAPGGAGRDPDVLAGAVRIELAALAATGTLSHADATDALARLGLTAQPTCYAVAARLSVTAHVRAPNPGYAQRVAVAQIVAKFAQLRSGYLRSRERADGPTDDPARHSVVAVRTRLDAACPGYPTGGEYHVSTIVLLGATVTAAHHSTAWARARTQLSADLDRLDRRRPHGVLYAPWCLQRVSVRRLRGFRLTAG
jgi:hypothetical protein